ncbi:acyl-[ACP]--phospholipid O-acyltransferase [Planctopirus hydrillae]|uniref:AMP-dependent synthetase n=1 Tax=Planctopirus hydrillae TaxID=1841610 RepID=A0A1C3ET25_9PLAN|nr:acyl-[ACP]--phospholipid O-acyltransferase [Planctopirus hydrillae]ODA36354.1 AMP-dependent synthetase [Planctopirus hydrillae]
MQTLSEAISNLRTDESTEPPRPADLHDRLSSISFLSLLAVQFLTVLNDHTFRWLVVPLAKRLFRHTPGKVSLAEDASMLALGLAAFTLPFLFLAAPAGYLADRFSKAKVITWCKLAEILIMLAGFAALGFSNIPLLFIVVALTGVMNALFAPARQGSIPELVHDGSLSRANGLMGLMNVVPCALGFLLGNLLATLAQPGESDTISWQSLSIAFVVIMSIAVLGWVVSLGIRRVPAGDPECRFPWNFPVDTWQSLKLLSSDIFLARTALGIAFFWLLASMAQLNIDTFAGHDLQLKQWQVGVFGMVLVLGVGIGSLLAGYLSGGHVELGLVPIGAMGIAICSVVLYLAGIVNDDHRLIAFELSVGGLFFLGVFAGLFDVPLEAYLQHRSEPKVLGKILAATNFLAFSGALAAAGIFYFLLAILQLSPAAVFLVCGIGTVPVAIYVMFLIPGAMFRFLFFIFTHSFYRIRRYGEVNIPEKGGALLVSNHVTWVDGILLMTMTPRPVRFIAYADYVNLPWLNWLARIFEIIPIKADGGPKALIESLRTARKAIEEGHVVCIFAEGGLTRTGQMQPFQPGFLKIIQGTNAPVIPVYLDGLWGSIFSFKGGKFFWKWPKRLLLPVNILYGQPIHEPKTVHQVRSAVQLLGVESVQKLKSKEPSLLAGFIKTCRSAGSRIKVADSGGMELSGTKLLIATLAFNRLFRRQIPGDEQVVGILLPPTVGGVLANVALSLAGKVTANLNYTLSDAQLNACLEQGDIKTVITSRKVLEKRNFQLNAKFLLLEDLKPQVSTFDKFCAALAAYTMPASLLLTLLGRPTRGTDELLTLIFTSGSTGQPKGVMLTHNNLKITIDAADHIARLEADDTVLGVLPFFHSLGYSITLWLPLCLPPRVVYHVNPLDARVVGQLAEKYGATILLATPTFLRSYLKRCEPAQFSKLDLVVVGAEKLPNELANEFKEKFGVLPSEGYGATETTGPAFVNVPDHRCELTSQKGTKLGTVGRPLPGFAVRILDPESGQEVGVNIQGRVQLKGGNVMAGYWKNPEKTSEVLQDGWYDTGDLGVLDDEGFLTITGRLSRFSKVGGEMVPHLRVEELLLEIVKTSDDEGALPLAVTAVPDAQRGERLVVVHRPLAQPVAEILRKLGETGIPNLWIPGADSFIEVEAVPILGTGKLDLKGIKDCALARFGPKS